MDIGLIILFIMISIIGNIIKESQKQKDWKNKRSKRQVATKSMGDIGSMLKRTIEDMGSRVHDEDSSMEEKRTDIGETFESQDILKPEASDEVIKESIAENKLFAENTESESTNVNDSVNLKFDRDALINAIIMSEVLSPPKCRR